MIEAMNNNMSNEHDELHCDFIIMSRDRDT